MVLNELKMELVTRMPMNWEIFDVPSIINRHLGYMSSKNIKIPLDMEHLLYWLQNCIERLMVTDLLRHQINVLPNHFLAYSVHVLQR